MGDNKTEGETKREPTEGYIGDRDWPQKGLGLPPEMRLPQALLAGYVPGTARQPLFSLLLSRFIYLSVCLSVYNFRRCKPPGNRMTPGVAYLQIAYDQTAGVRNIFPSASCGCH